MSAKLPTTEAFGGAEEVYATPKWPVDRLVDEIGDVLPRGGQWLEPAVGDGAIVRAVDARLQLFGATIDWTTVDIRDTGAAGNTAHYVADFTELALPSHGDRRWAFDCAITNPPFSLAERYVRRMTALSPLAILLLPLPWIGGSERWGLFDELPPSALYVIPDRVQFIDPTIATPCPRCGGEGAGACKRCKGVGTVKASSPAVDHAWWCWSAFHRGPTTIHRLAPTPLAERQWWRKPKAISTTGIVVQDSPAASGSPDDAAGRSSRRGRDLTGELQGLHPDATRERDASYGSDVTGAAFLGGE